MPRVAIVAQPSEVFEFLGYVLSQEGYHVRFVHDPKIALTRIKSLLPDVVILDSDFSIATAQDVCTRIRWGRSKQDRIPILIVRPTLDTAPTMSPTGGDVYLERPLRPRSVIACVRALVERKPPEENRGQIVAGDLVIDPVSCKVTRSGRLLAIRLPEFRLLHYLASRPNLVCPRKHLLYILRGIPRMSSLTVEVLIRQVRKKIDENSEGPSRIRSIRGQGFCFYVPGGIAPPRVVKGHQNKFRG